MNIHLIHHILGPKAKIDVTYTYHQFKNRSRDEIIELHMTKNIANIKYSLILEMIGGVLIDKGKRPMTTIMNMMSEELMIKQLEIIALFNLVR
jgi:hypothetical protein